MPGASSRPVNEPVAQPATESLVERYAAAPYPVLILGPPGIGKTTLAARLHIHSGRDGMFVPCSMAGIPEHLEHSHLAGHTRGSFTGAVSDQKGKIESAHRGTLFLDELGLASAKVQEILLELLDHGTLQRIGEVRKRPLHVRLVAATNADLWTMRDRGEFRADLLGRFGYFIIRLRPLRERRHEIRELFLHHLERVAVELAIDHPPVARPPLMSCLRSAPWPDNIRQVKSVCRYLLIHWDGASELDVGDLPPEFLDELGLGPADQTAGDRDRAREMVARTGGNKAEAARRMGVSRRHLYRLLNQ